MINKHQHLEVIGALFLENLDILKVESFIQEGKKVNGFCPPLLLNATVLFGSRIFMILCLFKQTYF